MQTGVFEYKKTFTLESGKKLPGFQLHYQTFGTYRPEKNNVVWVLHALTGNSNPFDWWKGLFGENDLYNPKDYFIICANSLGSHYGSTGPLSVNKKTGTLYYHLFPEITNRDIVDAFDLLRKHLNINKIHTLIGGSLGGQQALEWAIKSNTIFDNLIVLATNAKHSAWGIAFNESQRLAIKTDRSFYSPSIDAGLKGLKTARSIAMLSYRTYNQYNINQTDDNCVISDFKASSYQNYQGEKLMNRFNAFSYVNLTKAMDSHNVGRERVDIEHALEWIKANTLVIGIDSDILFPFSESITLHKYIENSYLYKLESDYGHDGFLVETKQISEAIKQFYIKNYIQMNNNKRNENEIGLFGFGTVGQGFYNCLQDQNQEQLIKEIVIQNIDKKRKIKNFNFTTDYNRVFKNNNIKVIVELISDYKKAYVIIKNALLEGKKVISANKKAIVYNLIEFIELEQKRGGKLLFEGAVCGSIPIIRLLNTFYNNDQIYSVRGIFNGTSNYILTKLFNSNDSFQEALIKAKENGFAEEDPTSDVGGYDSQYKLLILNYLIFGKHTLPEESLRVGIENIQYETINFAKQNNFKIKLLASSVLKDNKLISFVLPTFISSKSDLYNVENEINGIEIVSKNVGLQFYKGKGAGKQPIGQAVYSDFNSDTSYRNEYKQNTNNKIKHDVDSTIWVYTNNVSFFDGAVFEKIYKYNLDEGYVNISLLSLLKKSKDFGNQNISIVHILDEDINELIHNISKFAISLN